MAATAATAQIQSVAELEKANEEKTIGPGAVPVTLTVNGEKLRLMPEPRVTLLDALRNYSGYTGAKEGCDRATRAGPAQSCWVTCRFILPETCHRGTRSGNHHGRRPDEERKNCRMFNRLFEKDALMCGYCTPGFLMSVTALLKTIHTPMPPT